MIVRIRRGSLFISALHVGSSALTITRCRLCGPRQCRRVPACSAVYAVTRLTGTSLELGKTSGRFALVPEPSGDELIMKTPGLRVGGIYRSCRDETGKSLNVPGAQGRRLELSPSASFHMTGVAPTGSKLS
jgi:hypothetical protein